MKLDKKSMTIVGLAAIFIVSLIAAFLTPFRAEAQSPYYLVGGELEITSPLSSSSTMSTILAITAIAIGVAIAFKLR